MGLHEEAYQEMRTLSTRQIENVYNFILFEKYKDIHEMDDTTYLSSIPGMMESIDAAIAAPRSERVPLEEVWPDV